MISSSRLVFVWWASLITYSSYVVLSPASRPSSVAFIPFYLALPGYAFCSLFLPNIGRTNKVGLSLIVSPALAVGLASAIRVSMLGETVSGVGIMDTFTLVVFAAKMAQEVRRTPKT